MEKKDNNYTPDIDRLLKTAERLEQRADAIPSWRKGTIVFAEAPPMASATRRPRPVPNGNQSRKQ